MKILRLGITVLIMALTLTGQAFGQADKDKVKVQSRGAAMMMQMSRPQEFTPDSSMIRVIKSDSTIQKVDAQTLKKYEKRGVKMYEIPGDPREVLLRQMRRAMQKYPGPPVAVRTVAGKGNRVRVYVKNRTDRPLSKLLVQADRLPEGWQSQPARRLIYKLPAGHQQTVAFELQAPSTAPRNVGFELKTMDGLTISWTARVGLPESGTEKLPVAFELHGNYPNPFRRVTTISYSLPQTMRVQLSIYNVLGQKVATPVNEEQQSGVQNETWDATAFASGTYIYRLVATAEDGERFVSEKKMVLVK